MVKGLFRYAAAIAAAAFIVSCGQSDGVKVTVTNGSELARNAETVELDFGAIKAGHPEITAENVVVTDAAGAQVPSQVYVESYGQEKLVFQATVDAGKTVKYKVSAGEPEVYDTLVFSRYVPERLDDYAYENNRIAGRVYGPALEDPRTLGPDIWLKRVEDLVVNKRYILNDYHHDHGDGLDCYKVANTLGGGALAPYDEDGKIVLGDNYETWNRLCNGPVRTKVEFTYPSFKVDGRQVNLKREFTIDANTNFIKVSNWFDANVDSLPVVLGAVLHDVIAREDGANYIAFTEKASDSLNPEQDGDISVGLVVDAAEAGVSADTMDGHAVLKFECTPGKRVDVWIGSGWSKGGIESPEAWAAMVKDFAYAQAHPLTVTVE